MFSSDGPLDAEEISNLLLGITRMKGKGTSHGTDILLSIILISPARGQWLIQTLHEHHLRCKTFELVCASGKPL